MLPVPLPAWGPAHDWERIVPVRAVSVQSLRAQSAGNALRLFAFCVRPAVGCFEDAHVFQDQGFVAQFIDVRFQQFESLAGKVFCSGHDIEHDRAMLGH